MTYDEVGDAYRRYGHLVLRRCQRILRDDAAADDALQEVFLRLWRWGDAFRQAESKVSWLYRVADRCCFDHMHRRRTRPEEPYEHDQDIVATGGGNYTQALEDRQIVMRFLERFDDRVKQIAVLYCLDELTQDEIAEATGLSRQTISKKLGFLRERASQLRAQFRGPEGNP